MDVMGWEGCDGVWYGIDMIVVTRQGETGKQNAQLLFFSRHMEPMAEVVACLQAHAWRTRRDWDASQQ